MDKRKLCEEIGNYFGDFFVENGQLCIDNGETVFRYDTEDALLAGWVDTLIENHHDAYHVDADGNEWDSWEKEIIFIFNEVIGKPPVGIRMIENKNGITVKAYIDISNGTLHGKNLHLGTYTSIVDAIFARRDWLSRTGAEEGGRCSVPIAYAEMVAQEIAARAKQLRQVEKFREREKKLRKKYSLDPANIAYDIEQAKKAMNGTEESIYEVAWILGYAKGLQAQNPN